MPATNTDSLAAFNPLAANPVLPWWKDNGLRKLVFWQCWILAAQIVVGFDEVINGSFQSMQPWREAMGYPSSDILGLITCSVFIGAFVGAFFTAPLTDRFGRCFALQIGSFMELVGSIIQAAAPKRGVYIGGRAILGIGLAFTTSAGPTLLAELSHPRLRGKITPMYNVLWYVGSIIASWLSFGTGHLGSQWSWRIPSIVQAVFPFMLMVGVSFMPESPRWLFAHGRQEEARAIIVEYHANGNEADGIVAFEMDEIDAALKLEMESKTYTWASLLKSNANRRRMFIILMVATGTLWNGQSIVTYYFTSILDSVGITSTNQQMGINGGMAIFNLLSSIFGVFLAERIGRRPLWLTSFIAMVFANVPLTIASAVYKEHGSQAAAYVAVVSMFLYNGAFNLACNPLPYSYVPEILPFSIRSKGLSLYIIISQAWLTVSQYVNPIAMDDIGYYYYVFYLGMLLLFIAIIYFTFPETRGFSLEELGTLFEDNVDVWPEDRDGEVVIIGQELNPGRDADREAEDAKSPKL